jgi:hypothetical protein
MVEMLDYRLHAAILATEDRVRQADASRHDRGPVRVHGLRLRALRGRSSGRSRP